MLKVKNKTGPKINTKSPEKVVELLHSFFGKPHVSRADWNRGGGLEEDVRVQRFQDVGLGVPEVLVGAHSGHVPEESVVVLFLLVALHLADEPVVIVHGSNKFPNFESFRLVLAPELLLFVTISFWFRHLSVRLRLRQRRVIWIVSS